MTKKAPKNKEIEQAGRLLAYVYETTRLSYKRMLALSFARGVVTGFGGVIGGTIGVSILIWLLSILIDVPILGSLVENLRESLQQ